MRRNYCEKELVRLDARWLRGATLLLGCMNLVCVWPPRQAVADGLGRSAHFHMLSSMGHVSTVFRVHAAVIPAAILVDE